MCIYFLFYRLQTNGLYVECGRSNIYSLRKRTNSICIVSDMNMATCRENCWIKDVKDIWRMDESIQNIVKEKI